MLSLQFVYVPKLWQCLHLSGSSWAHLSLGPEWRKFGLCRRDRMGSFAAAEPVAATAADLAAFALALALVLAAVAVATAGIALPTTLTASVAAAARLPRSGDFCKGILQVSLQSAKHATTTRRKV